MSEINQPAIGDHLLTMQTQVLDSNGDPKYALLVLDGSSFDESVYPILHGILGTNVLPTRTNEDPRILYKVVAG